MSRAGDFQRVEQGGQPPQWRCRAGRRGTRGCRSTSFSRRSISKQRGAAMSSRLMPPKLPASRLDRCGRSRPRPWLRMHRGKASTSAKALNRAHLPSITGHARLRADVPQAQHRGAVGDHGHQIAPAGQLIGLVHVLLDLQAGLGHAGGIGQGKVLPAADRAPGR